MLRERREARAEADAARLVQRTVVDLAARAEAAKHPVPLVVGRRRRRLGHVLGVPARVVDAAQAQEAPVRGGEALEGVPPDVVLR